MVFEVTRNGAAYPVSANWTNISADLHTGTFSLTQEGEYVVKMRYTDRSGNVMEDYVSDTLIVDTTVPELTVTGVDADSANKMCIRDRLKNDPSSKGVTEVEKNEPLVDKKSKYYEAEGELLSASFKTYRALMRYYCLLYTSPRREPV